MKKQTGNKLRLSIETLRNLTDPQLQEAAGGITARCGGTSSDVTCTATQVSDCHCHTLGC